MINANISTSLITSETHCPKINATFLCIIRMFGWSFVSSTDNALLNLQKRVMKFSLSHATTKINKKVGYGIESTKH